MPMCRDSFISLSFQSKAMHASYMREQLLRSFTLIGRLQEGSCCDALALCGATSEQENYDTAFVETNN
jgi:hypothetical protein